MGRDGNVPAQEEVTSAMVHIAELQQFGSLLVAGLLRRGIITVGGVFGGQDRQGMVTLGLFECFKLLREHSTPACAQEGWQASAQALSRLSPGVILEKLAHGVSGEIVLGKKEQSTGQPYRLYPQSHLPRPPRQHLQ